MAHDTDSFADHRNGRPPAVVTHDGRILVYASDAKEALQADFVKYTVQPVNGDEEDEDFVDEANDDDDEDESEDDDDNDDEEPTRALKGKGRAASKPAPAKTTIVKPVRAVKTKPTKAPSKVHANIPNPTKSSNTASNSKSRRPSHRDSVELSDDSVTPESLPVIQPHVSQLPKEFSPLLLADLPPIRVRKKGTVPRSPSFKPTSHDNHSKPHSRASQHDHFHHNLNQNHRVVHQPVPGLSREQHLEHRLPSDMQHHASRPVSGPTRQQHLGPHLAPHLPRSDPQHFPGPSRQQHLQPHMVPDLPHHPYGYYHGHGQFNHDPRAHMGHSPYLPPPGAPYSHALSPQPLPDRPFISPYYDAPQGHQYTHHGHQF